MVKNKSQFGQRAVETDGGTEIVKFNRLSSQYLDIHKRVELTMFGKLTRERSQLVTAGVEPFAGDFHQAVREEADARYLDPEFYLNSEYKARTRIDAYSTPEDRLTY